jgi:hypothetical protein
MTNDQITITKEKTNTKVPNYNNQTEKIIFFHLELVIWLLGIVFSFAPWNWAIGYSASH